MSDIKRIFQRCHYVPLLALELKEVRGTVMSGSNDLALVQPDDRQVRKERGTD
jgi:hypothetical protein